VKTIFLNGVKVYLISGNIVKESVDAIINAANSRLAHGAGVAEAIKNAAGPALVKESEDIIENCGSVRFFFKRASYLSERDEKEMNKKGCLHIFFRFPLEKLW